jgi:hypothetical protein
MPNYLNNSNEILLMSIHTLACLFITMASIAVYDFFVIIGGDCINQIIQQQQVFSF